MSGLWRNNPSTPEGKFPILLRRDGTPMESRYFAIVLKDEAAPAALRAYADVSESLGRDPEFVRDVRALADSECAIECDRALRGETKHADPDAPPHRRDDPVVLAWARSLGCPGT